MAPCISMFCYGHPKYLTALKCIGCFTVMGPIVNYGLIGMLAVALLSSLGLLVLFVYHSLRIPRKEGLFTIVAEIFFAEILNFLLKAVN